jgi:Holliday junction DNA helicase RuvB
MGKRTIALAFAEEFGSTAKVAFGRSIDRKGDLTAILTSLETCGFLLIEEICRIRQPLKEILGPALEDFRIDLLIGQGWPLEFTHSTSIHSLASGLV